MRPLARGQASVYAARSNGRSTAHVNETRASQQPTATSARACAYDTDDCLPTTRRCKHPDCSLLLCDPCAGCVPTGRTRMTTCVHVTSCRDFFWEAVSLITLCREGPLWTEGRHRARVHTCREQMRSMIKATLIRRIRSHSGVREADRACGATTTECPRCLAQQRENWKSEFPITTSWHVFPQPTSVS